MAINYTSLLGLAQPVTGTESNTWGTVVNDEITALIEQAVAGGETINVTSGDVTLTDIDGAPSQARNAILLISGTPGTTRNVIAPSQSKTYVVINGSNAAVVIKGSATTGVTIASGARSIVAWNGSDFVEVAASGDVDGPASATDTAIARFSGTSGKVIQNSGVTIDGSNNVSGVAQLNATTADLTNLEVTNIKAKDGTAAGSIANATGVVTLNSAVLTTADINGGTVDGAAIGGTTPAAGKFTTLEAIGVSTFAAGTVSAPSITTTGDTNTGIYFPAADTIAFAEGGVEAMRIDSSGNVGIGTSSPVVRLHNVGQTHSVTGFSTANDASTFTPSGLSAIPNYGMGHQGSNVVSMAGFEGLTYYTNQTERMRIDSSGNVGIGTSSPVTNLDVNGNAFASNFVLPNDGYLYWGVGDGSAFVRGNSSSDYVSFGTVGVERARITSGGQFLVNTSSSLSADLHSFQSLSGANGVIALRNSSASAGHVWRVGPDASSNFILYNENTTGVFLAYGNTSWSANSDERLKDIIEPINNAAEKVSSLRAVIGKYKTDAEGVRRSFLIAQDVEKVLPEVVRRSSLPNSEDKTEYLTLAYTETIPLLVAAIKELKAELDTVKAELQTLKGN